MAAIDTPPGLGLPGIAVGWFGARPGPRRLARRCFALVALAAVFEVVVVARHPSAAHVANRVTWTVLALALAGLTLAVREARVGIAADGVRWGWGGAIVRMEPSRITVVRIYDDAIAVVARRGSPWFLFARDWDRFEAMRRAVATAGLPGEELTRRAPWTARLQSYGRVVDVLAVASAGVMIALVFDAL